MEIDDQWNKESVNMHFILLYSNGDIFSVQQ